MNLSIRQLQAFREVMRTGSISEAARALHRTQPAVSAMITSLEEELGLALFVRQRGRLTKTPEASFLLGESEAILERLVRVSRTMKELSNLQEGQLRIACMPASSQFLIPNLVAGFIKDKPKVKVSIMMRASSVIEEWIASQQYDLGIAELPAPNSAITTIPLDMHCVCAMRVDDPLAQKKVITPEDLSGKPLATLQEEHPNLLATRKAFEQHGADFNARFELRNFQPALKLVEEGLCYSICDPMTADSYFEYKMVSPELTFRPFAPSILLSIGILTPSQRPASLLTVAFTEILHKYLIELDKKFTPDRL
ncbi:LysR substrate-binding domain-containing protein [Vibrio sp. HN007]|uniref:LysR substrate-binding domain-containing protein n=1 Tax=Vibrio iocasae TaxID=3098914 RepID=UPI0035D456A9